MCTKTSWWKLTLYDSAKKVEHNDITLEAICAVTPLNCGAFFLTVMPQQQYTEFEIKKKISARGNQSVITTVQSSSPNTTSVWGCHRSVTERSICISFHLLINHKETQSSWPGRNEIVNIKMVDEWVNKMWTTNSVFSRSI